MHLRASRNNFIDLWIRLSSPSIIIEFHYILPRFYGIHALIADRTDFMKKIPEVSPGRLPRESRSLENLIETSVDNFIENVYWNRIRFYKFQRKTSLKNLQESIPCWILGKVSFSFKILSKQCRKKINFISQIQYFFFHSPKVIQ